MSVFDRYKPLRNKVRRLRLEDALPVLHAYFCFLGFEKPLPRGLGHWKMGLYGDNPGRGVGLYEWELDVLTREILLNGANVGDRSISDWKYLAELSNEIKAIENCVGSFYPKEERDIWLELSRIAHRQFSWQAGVTHPYVIRYFKIFSDVAVDRIVQDVRRMTVQEIYQIGLSLCGHFLQNYVTDDLRNEINDVSEANTRAFIKSLSKPLPELRAACVESQQYNLNWAYVYNPLRFWPLIDLQAPSEGQFACPSPSFLLRRITDGLYYDIVARPGFSEALGTSFQNYVGEVLNRANVRGTYTVLGEERYGRPGRWKQSVDWIVDHDDAAVFIECKAKRLRNDSKVDLHDTRSLRGDLSKMAEAVAQTYRTLQAAKDGLYSHWAPAEKPIFPVVATLENWHVFGSRLLDEITLEAKGLLDESGIDSSIIDAHPFTVAAIEDLEIAMQYASREGIREVFGGKIEGEHRLWSLGPYLNSAWADPARPPTLLFPEEWGRIDPRVAELEPGI